MNVTRRLIARGSFMVDAIMAFAVGSTVLFVASYMAPIGVYAVSDSENDTLAHWLASNVVNETMARQQFPKIGSTYEFSVEYAGYGGWAVHSKVEAAGWATIRRLTVEVFKLPNGQTIKRLPANAVAIAKLETFLRNPEKRTKANSATGSASGLPGL